MTLEIALVFGIIAIAMYLFITETLRIDITAILILTSLIVFGLVTPEEGVSGFSNPATLTVLGMFIVSGAIQKTGLIHIIGKKIFALAGNSEIKQILVIAVLIGPISGLINNTAMVAIMLPMIIGLSEKSKRPATKLLIPLSFLAMLGGTLTIVGTSTNILANDVMIRMGYEGFSFFEFAKLGVIVLAVGTIYFIVIGRFLLPSRPNKEQSEKMLDFMTEIEVREKSNAVGKTIQELQFENKYDVKVTQIKRGRRTFKKYISKRKLHEGDILMVTGNHNRILDLHKKEGFKILANFDEESRKLDTKSGNIVKLLITGKGALHARKLSRLDFQKKYNASVIAIQHRKKLYASRLREIPLKIGDALLVQVSDSNLGALKRSKDFLVLKEVQEEFQWNKMLPVLLISGGTLLLAALNILPLMVAVLLGVVALFISGIFKDADVYDTVRWDIIFLLAGVIPLSIAMEQTGASNLIANGLVGIAGLTAPIVMLGIFYAVTTIITEIISNNAAVILLIPVAINTAEQLGLNPIAFVLAVMFAASTSFLSPVGYQTNTMVYSAGNYKFSDFWKVGLPLNIILMFVTTFFIAEFWGL